MNDSVSAQDFETLRAATEKLTQVVIDMEKRITQLEEAKVICDCEAEREFWADYERRSRGVA